MVIQPNLSNFEVDALVSKLRALGLSTAEANQIAIGGEDDGVAFPSIDDANPVIIAVNANVVTLTATASTIAAGDNLVLVDAASNDITVTLPDPAAGNQTVAIKRIDGAASSVRIASAAAANIDGGVQYALNTQYEAIVVVSDGTQWWVL